MLYFLAMADNRKAAVKKLKKLVIEPREEVEAYRSRFEETLSEVFLPHHVERVEHDYGTIRSDVLIPELSSVGKVILYIHGGSFTAGSRISYRTFCASLSNACSCRLVLPEFRLAPKHPFPAAIDDVQSVYTILHGELKASRAYGSDGSIVLAADGSGASIALALLQRLNEEDRKDISQLLLFSPWLDFSPENEILASRKLHDEIISGEKLHRAADIYTYASNFRNPLVSPLCALPEKLHGFPPVYIQVGEKEILLRQAIEFRHLAEEAGVSCTVDSWPGMMFMFQMADEFLADAQRAIDAIGARIKDAPSSDLDDAAVRAERDLILRKNNIGS